MKRDERPQGAEWGAPGHAGSGTQKSEEGRSRITRLAPGHWRDLPVLLFPLLFLSLFFFYPLLAILSEGLTDTGGRFTLAHLVGLFSDPAIARTVLFTVEQASLSTLASILLGLPGAFILARYDFRGKSLVTSLCTVPFVLPSIIVVLGFVIFFGNNGLLNRALMGAFRLDDPPLKVLYSMRAIVLAHTFYNFPIAVRLVSAVWSRANPDLERAARSLGARGPRLFTRVLLPQVAPGVFAAAALIFIFCFTSFAVVLVLGGGPRYSTIEVSIYRLARVSLDLKAGSALAIVESLLSALFMYVYIRLQHRVSFIEKGRAAPERRSLKRLFRSPFGAPALIYLAAAFTLIVAPMLSAVGYSFLERSGWAGKPAFSLAWYGRILGGSGSGGLGVSYLAAVRNSVLLGLAAAGLALTLGTAVSYGISRKDFPGRGVLEALAMLPLGVSSVILGLGYVKAYQGLPLPIAGKWYAVAIAHTVIAYPFVVRSTAAVFRKINPNVTRAALSLGASPWKTFWKAELPMIRAGIVAGAVFAFGISIGEINATLMLAGPGLTTLPIAIYRLIGSYNYYAACALGAVLMLICFLVFLVIDKIGFEVS